MAIVALVHTSKSGKPVHQINPNRDFAASHLICNLSCSYQGTFSFPYSIFFASTSSVDMLVLMSATLWSSEHFNSLHSYSSSILQSRELLHHDHQASSNQQGHNSGEGINPFEVIYDRKKRTSQLPSPNRSSSTEQYKTASYIRIEKSLNQGLSPAREASQEPIVTVIGGSIRRSGSVVSLLASVRHRNTIRRRNKMVRKEQLLPVGLVSPSPDSTSKKARGGKKRSPLAFLYPIKRKTSLKYSPVIQSPLRFKSQRELDEYYLLNNVAAVMKELLPRTMNIYNYSLLAQINPNLTAHPKRFAISRDSKFSMIDRPVLQAKFPLHGAKISESNDIDRGLPGPSQDRQGTPELKRRAFLSTVCNKYREVVFAGGFDIPPRIEELLPFEADIMSAEERLLIDVQILFEVLVRRTVAAKIGYRLKQSGRRSGQMQSSQASHHDSSSGYENAREPSPRQRGLPKRGFEHFKEPRQAFSDASNSDNTSLDTNQIMEHNASLLSELLPSPQISLASNAFEPGLYHPMLGEDPSQRQRRVHSSSAINSTSQFAQLVSRMSSTKARAVTYSAPVKEIASTSSIYSSVPSTGKRQTGDVSRRSSKKTSGSISPSLKKDSQFSSPSEMFVNDFNKVYYATEKNKKEENKISNLNLYSLQPRNRSNHTLSSSADSSSFGSDEILQLHDQEKTVSSAETKSVERDVLSQATTTSASRVNRSSHSTADTSILHSLEDLSNRVSEYLRDSEFEAEEINPREKTESVTDGQGHRPALLDLRKPEIAFWAETPDDRTPTTLLFPASSSSKTESPSRLISPEHLVKSMESVVSSIKKASELDKNLLGINFNGSPKKVSQGLTDYEREILSVRGSIHGGYTETTISASERSSIHPLNVRRKSNVTSVLGFDRVLKRNDSYLSIMS